MPLSSVGGTAAKQYSKIQSELTRENDEKWRGCRVKSHREGFVALSDLKKPTQFFTAALKY